MFRFVMDTFAAAAFNVQLDVEAGLKNVLIYLVNPSLAPFLRGGVS